MFKVFNVTEESLELAIDRDGQTTTFGWEACDVAYLVLFGNQTTERDYFLTLFPASWEITAADLPALKTALTPYIGG